MTDRLINIISNTNYESRDVTARLMSILKSQGFTSTKKFSDKAELTIVVGGDGAFIKAVHKSNFSQIPIVGINTGHLGFYQEILPNDLEEFVEDYMVGNYSTVEITLLGAEVFTSNRRYFLTAINELVLKAQHSKVIHMDVFVDRNHLEKFSGDGILIATPSGSTGYNMSGGGSLIYPKLEALEITPLNPISSSAYRALPNSMIVPSNLVISLVPEKRYANSNLVLIDGFEFEYKNLKKINVRASDKKIVQLVFSKNNYWENIKSKFL